MNFTFDIHGNQSQFRIEKVDDKEKEKRRRLATSNITGYQILKMGYLDSDFEISINDEKEPKSTINLNVTPLTIYLSTESFYPLIVFFKSFVLEKEAVDPITKLKEEEEDEQKESVDDYKKIMDCINYNSKTQEDNVRRYA